MAVVGAAGAGSNDGAALAQAVPLPISIDQDTTLVQNAVQKKRRLDLYPLQTGDIDAASADALQTCGKLVARR
ncbi:MAG TPA: hypothetical protein VHS55_08895 [Solirubrobacteraceae bacterium]|nr:hypothetical protein [Solirubrobacteraceae bacterium]